MTSAQAAATYETLLTDVTDGVALITINRPDVRNAVNRQVQLDIRTALDAFRDDDSVAVVVFTGAGEKAFVAGADIAQVREYTLHTALASDLQRLYDDVEAYEKPTIAAKNNKGVRASDMARSLLTADRPAPTQHSRHSTESERPAHAQYCSRSHASAG